MKGRIGCNMAVIRTVGSGGDLANWNEAFSFLPLLWVNDFVFKQISDIEITSGLTDFNSSYNSNGHKVTIFSTKPHYGNINEGYKTIINSSSDITLFHFPWVGENVEIFNLNFYVENYSSANFTSVLYLQPGKRTSGIPTRSVSKIIHDNIFQLNDKIRYGIFQTGNMPDITNIASTDHYWNNKILDPKEICMYLLEYDGQGLDFYCENNTCYSKNNVNGIRIFDIGSIPKYIINNAVLIPAPGINNCFVYSAASVARGNMSQDDTADDAPVQSGNFINAVPGDEFEINPAKPDFLYPLRHSQAYNGGVKTGIGANKYGIEGHPRPHRI